MPELPEVETTKRGLAPLICHQIIQRVSIYRAKLRWEIPPHLPKTLVQQPVLGIERRGKYLLLKFEVGTLLIHLGMSGSISVVNAQTPLKKHDHFALCFANGMCMRLNDPRRFGSVLFTKNGAHPLLDNLGVEPLSALFDDNYLYQASRQKQQSIKAFVMNSRVVVGVGNIYACESLYAARILPKRRAGSISKQRYARLTEVIKRILTEAIEAGGTTLQDFSKVDGTPGYFAQKLSVYGRAGECCPACSGKIRKITQHQRTTFYCPKCQT